MRGAAAYRVDLNVLEPAAEPVWTSDWHDPGFAFSRAIVSWNATTPPGTWIDVELQARTEARRETAWFVMGRWASDDSGFRRTSVPGQEDPDASVAVDVFVAEQPMQAYRLRLTLHGETPRVTRVSCAVSNDAPAYSPSESTVTSDVILEVPAYSQELHAGHYPEFDSGGETWCSPASTAMILGFWGVGPAPSDYAWVTERDPDHPDPWVDHAARFTYDHGYRGAGNWPFNVAYACGFGLEGFVTQLRSLAEAEQFIRAGIPLVASLSVGPGELDGFLLEGTRGHLLTIVGFTATGDVVSNDPAALANDEVRRVYDREQFERAWMTSTGGVVYVLHPPGTALPL